MSWREFWNQDHSIYVSDRHRSLHGEWVAGDFIALIPSPGAHVLDHGCGDALSAEAVARRCGRLLLYDASENARARLAQRLAASGIAILDEAALAALPAASLDMVFCCSVLQYVAPAATDDLFQLWHDRLKPGGRLVVADVIAPGTPMARDVVALLRFALKGGFLPAALRGLVATYFSPYRKLRGGLGLSTYREEEMLALLRRHGFAGERAARNVGHNQARMTFVATRAGDAAAARDRSRDVVA